MPRNRDHDAKPKSHRRYHVIGRPPCRRKNALA
jgi:hypothetical protein